MGGGSRYDIDSVGPLRFMGAFVLAIALWWQSRENLHKISVPLILLIALAVWMALQLVPLPPGLWHALPGREAIVGLGEIVGITEIWRPITLSPLRTWNALASLIIPLAALLTLSLLDREGWGRVQKLVFFAGLASALLGILQITIPGASGLYFYQITNADSAVGLFSNRNHNALFLNIALIFAIFLRKPEGRDNAFAINAGYLAGQMVLVLGILINGSRFGLLMLLLVFAAFAVKALTGMRGRPSKWGAGQMVGLAVGVVSVAFVGMFALLGRIPALDRFFSASASEDLRARSFPFILDMAGDYFPLGTGFGTFEHAYRTVEPVELLGPAYFNQAHNDWLQIVLEGGLPGVALLVILIGYLAWKFLQFLKAGKLANEARSAHWAGFLTLALFAMHSVFDYPLRTPLLMVVGVVAVMLAIRPVSEVREMSGRKVSRGRHSS